MTTCACTFHHGCCMTEVCTPPPSLHHLIPQDYLLRIFKRMKVQEVETFKIDNFKSYGFLSSSQFLRSRTYNQHTGFDTNVTPRPPRGRACYPWQLSRISRLAPQTNTSLFCALCPHSCAPGINFLVGHRSSNRSRPSMFNLEFFLDELLEKKLQLVDTSILLILLSPRQGCHTLTPLEDRRPRRSTPVQELLLLDTSMRPVPTHVPRRDTCPHTWPAHARVTARVGSDTICGDPTRWNRLNPVHTSASPWIIS
jgi:hypothetical protein